MKTGGYWDRRELRRQMEGLTITQVRAKSAPPPPWTGGKIYGRRDNDRFTGTDALLLVLTILAVALTIWKG